MFTVNGGRSTFALVQLAMAGLYTFALALLRRSMADYMDYGPSMHFENYSLAFPADHASLSVSMHVHMQYKVIFNYITCIE
jgi:hypothetical protein